jgi:hypothetical protein
LSIRFDHAGQGPGAWAIRATAGRYRQFLNQFDVPTYNIRALLPSVRFWLPVDEQLEPSEAYHLTGAFLWTPNSNWELRMETYYKYQPRLLVLNFARTVLLENSQVIYSNPSDILTRAEGKAYGTAFVVQRRSDRFNLQLQYEYGVARRREKGRFNGNWMPAPWSAPHRLYAALDWSPTSYLTATLRWQGIAGRTWGFRQAYYDYLSPDPVTRFFDPFDVSRPDLHQLPWFSQLDMGAGVAWYVGSVRLQARFQLVNVLNRENVTEWSIRYNEGEQRYERIDRPGFPFMPAFSLSLAW